VSENVPTRSLEVCPPLFTAFVALPRCQSQPRQ
jgi:hypothetical protein